MLAIGWRVREERGLDGIEGGGSEEAFGGGGERGIQSEEERGEEVEERETEELRLEEEWCGPCRPHNFINLHQPYLSFISSPT